MAGQAKYLHGVLLPVSSFSNPSFGEPRLSFNPSHICLSAVSVKGSTVAARLATAEAAATGKH